MLPLFSEHGFAGMRERWQRFDLCRERPVRVSVGDHHHQGRALGVAESGALLLEIDGQVRHFHGGEVSLRLS